MKILATGCLHANWDLLLDTIEAIQADGEKLDLVIVPGDAETMRSESDLQSLACPPKYRHMGSFYKIYNRERRMPVLTIVVGGNHEASDFIHPMPFGGWLAENIYFTGRANSLLFGSLKISALGGIYDAKSFFKPTKERFPIRLVSDSHTCNHIRAFSMFQLLGLESTDLFLSHDWPSSIASTYPDENLIRYKSYLIDSDKKQQLGIKNGMQLMDKLQPSLWLAAHHHIKFQCSVNSATFLALSKPPRDWFTILEVPGEPGELKILGEWISILKATNNEMLHPESLKTVDWSEKWELIRPNLEHFEDYLLEFSSESPEIQTNRLCHHFNLVSPIRLSEP